MTAGEKILQVYKILYSNFGPQGWWPSKTPHETVLGAILTQNVAWSNVEKALCNLEAAKIFTLEEILHTPAPILADLILSARFSRQKAAYLHEMAAFLKTYRYSFQRIKAALSPKELRKTLLKIKGIGPETADTLLLYAFELPFFVIDAYTKRISFRLGLTSDESISYSALQELFQTHLPSEVSMFNEYHALLVKLAKVHCLKRNPVCGTCPLVSLCLRQGL